MDQRKVLLDQWSLTEPGSDRGLGRYALEIKAALENQQEWQVEPLLSKARVGRFPSTGIGAGIKASSSVDLYHALTVFHLPTVKTVPWICSIQDVIPLDLDAYRRFGIRTKLAFLSARRSDVILANSTYTADRVMARLKVPARKIEIASLPVAGVYTGDPSLVISQEQRRTRDRAPVVVALADGRTKDPRKRYHWISQLATSLRVREIEVIVAGRGLDSADYPDCALLDSPSDADLADLYTSSLAFFYPSAYEGQGLPPIEAMGSGLPVLAFRNTSITEMVGSGGFLFEDPEPWESGRLEADMPESTLSALVDACVQMSDGTSDLASLRTAARAQASRLTRDNLQVNLLAAYNKTVHGAFR